MCMCICVNDYFFGGAGDPLPPTEGVTPPFPAGAAEEVEALVLVFPEAAGFAEGFLFYL